MKTKYTEINRENGIGFSAYTSFQDDGLLHDDNGNTILFGSIESLKSYITRKLKIKDTSEYVIWLVDKDDNGERIEIEYDNIQECNGYYQYFYNDALHFIKPQDDQEVVTCGYLVFEDGDSKKTDKEYGKVRGRELYKYTTDIINKIVRDKVSVVERIYRDKKGFLSLKIKDSTSILKLCYNNEFMSLNQDRKNDGERCLPFDKNVDKFTTLYIFSTRECGEEYDSIYEIKDLINLIIEYLRNEYPEIEARYMKVPFSGYINYEREK